MLQCQSDRLHYLTSGCASSIALMRVVPDRGTPPMKMSGMYRSYEYTLRSSPTTKFWNRSMYQHCGEPLTPWSLSHTTYLSGHHDGPVVVPARARGQHPVEHPRRQQRGGQTERQLTASSAHPTSTSSRHSSCNQQFNFISYAVQIKLLIEDKLIICALGNLHYQISREKFEPEPGFQPRTSGFLALHPSQEEDLNMNWHENQDNSGGRAPG